MYLLKYSLNVTLQKMITSPNQRLMAVDEVAMDFFSKRISSSISQIETTLSIPFSPTEKLGYLATLTLLEPV